MLSGKCTTGKSIGAQKYNNTGQVNGQKAMLLRDTGADQTLAHGRYVPESAFTGTFVDVTLADGSARQIPIAIVRLEYEGITDEYAVGVIDTLPEDELMGNDVVDGQRHAYVVTRQQQRLEDEQDAYARWETAETGVKATAVGESSKQVSQNDQASRGEGADETMVADVLSLSRTEIRHLQETDVTLKAVRQHVIPLLEISHHRVCFYWKEGIMYRKWSPDKSGQPDVFEDVGPQVQELHQVVVPKVVRDTVLGLAHDIPLAGHLGVWRRRSNGCCAIIIGQLCSRTWLCTVGHVRPVRNQQKTLKRESTTDFIANYR